MGYSFRPEYRGRASEPAFYQIRKPVQQSSNSDSYAVGPVEIPNMVLYAGLVMLGVVVFLIARSEQQVIHTSPLITEKPSYGQDSAIIQNEIQAVHAITAARERASSVPVPATA